MIKKIIVMLILNVVLLTFLPAFQCESSENDSPFAKAPEVKEKTRAWLYDFPSKYASKPVVITDVNIIPMNKEQILSSRTVVINNGVIVKIDKKEKVSVPVGALCINGEGKYLVPGFADMHIHIGNKAQLLLYLANGITTARVAFGFPEFLEYRDSILKNRMLGPRLFVSGPIIDNNRFIQGVVAVNSTVEAKQIVDKSKKQGYDFIKVYDNLTPDVYEAVIDEANKVELKVMGHLPRNVGLEKALELGKLSSIEHLTGYIRPQSGVLTLVDDYGERTKSAGIWNCPTLVAFQKLAPKEIRRFFSSQPEMKYISKTEIDDWECYFTHLSEDELINYQENDSKRKKIVKSLFDSGARLLIGTDGGWGMPYVISGFSVHEEMKNFVDSGLTPYQTLRIATRDAAEYLNGLNQFGTIEVGKSADLILLDKNPIENILNTRKINGVFVRGMWLSRQDMDDMLKAIQDEPYSLIGNTGN